MTERFFQVVKNEVQLLFICHLVAPFLQRFNGEKPQMVCRLTISLYELLEKVDKATPADTPFIYMDVFCDLLYHIKYMFTGDLVKSEVEGKIRCLRPALQLRLRFITHLNIEDITTNPPVNTGFPGPTSNQQHLLAQQQQHSQQGQSLQSMLGI